MLETSKDLFYVVLAFSILWLSLFWGWFLYYVIKTLRSFYKVIERITDTVDKVDGLVEEVKEKLKKSSTYLGIIFDLVKEFSKKKKGSGKKDARPVKK